MTWMQKLNSMADENVTYLYPDFQQEHYIQEKINTVDTRYMGYIW